MSYKYEKIDRRLAFKGSIVDFYKETIKLPNDKNVEWDYIEHKGAVAVIPVDEDGKIIMVRQYRIGSDCELLEIPAGGINKGEEPYDAGMRELEEETGYKTEALTHLIDVYSAPAYTSECVYVYYSDKLVKSHTNYDEDEFISLERYDIEQLVDMIMSGEIVDGKTIAGLMAYYRTLQHTL
ncbi:MAG: NUDIX hydrolase [Lachnospiraceae bacterium]|nr:NUDIX hydrolase [Lachnospiraceae bacterium]